MFSFLLYYLTSLYSLNTQGINTPPRAPNSESSTNVISFPVTTHLMIDLGINNQQKTDFDMKLYYTGNITEIYLFSIKRLRCLEDLDSVSTNTVYLCYRLGARCFQEGQNDRLQVVNTTWRYRDRSCLPSIAVLISQFTIARTNIGIYPRISDSSNNGSVFGEKLNSFLGEVFD